MNRTFIFPLILILIITYNCSKKGIPIPNPTAGTPVTDIDGNVYKTVIIGTQEWMAENLKVTRYRNGDTIPNVTDTTWLSLQSGAYCWYNNDTNDTAAYKTTYGALYNWYAVSDSRNIAPIGWHVASDEPTASRICSRHHRSSPPSPAMPNCSNRLWRARADFCSRLC